MSGTTLYQRALAGVAGRSGSARAALCLIYVCFDGLYVSRVTRLTKIGPGSDNDFGESQACGIAAGGGVGGLDHLRRGREGRMSIQAKSPQEPVGEESLMTRSLCMPWPKEGWAQKEANHPISSTVNSAHARAEASSNIGYDQRLLDKRWLYVSRVIRPAQVGHGSNNAVTKAGEAAVRGLGVPAPIALLIGSRDPGG